MYLNSDWVESFPFDSGLAFPVVMEEENVTQSVLASSAQGRLPELMVALYEVKQPAACILIFFKINIARRNIK